MRYRLLAVLSARGVVLMILADARPDDELHIRALGGQATTSSPATVPSNHFDFGPLVASLNEIDEEKARDI